MNIIDYEIWYLSKKTFKRLLKFFKDFENIRDVSELDDGYYKSLKLMGTLEQKEFKEKLSKIKEFKILDYYNNQSTRSYFIEYKRGLIFKNIIRFQLIYRYCKKL